jgi:sensor histidine kinase regulating citrate/malate metabolism
MLYLGKYENATDYVDGITQNYTPMQEVIYVGDPALTALLHTKTKVAETEGIDFNFAIKCNLNEIGLKVWDLCSIVGNLLDNAFDACLSSRKEKRVSLEIKLENQNYLINVTNTGKKISKAVADHIFEPGFTTKNSKARGFGLFIVQNIVKEYGGTISIVYEPKTVFIISFPERSWV